MFSFEKIYYTTDAFRVVIETVINNNSLNNEIRVVITDNYTDEVLVDEVVNSSLWEVIKFVESY